jgi:hypothetical protein
MAFIEQLMCVLPGPGGQAAAILARSAGMTREMATEIVTLCARWSPPIGKDGVRALVSMPLRESLPGTPGRLYHCARACADGPGRTLVHSFAIAEADYAAFGYSPYRLEREGIFLERWASGLTLDRLECRPASLAALVRPLPDARDADLIDEALRLYFTSRKMVLPLARVEENGDRFLALFVESLPLYVRQRLTFASFAVGGQEVFDVGAVFMADGSFQAWRHSLMAAVRKALPPEIEAYMAVVRRHLTAGDLMGLDAVSRSLDTARIRSPRDPAGPARAENVTAAVTTQSAPVPDVFMRRCSSIAPPAPGGGATPGVEARSGQSGTSGGRVWLGLLAAAAIVVAVMLVVARRPDGRPDGVANREPAQAAVGESRTRDGGSAPDRDGRAAASEPEPAQVNPSPGGLGDVIDIGALYASELEVYGREIGSDPGEESRRAAADRALGALRERGAEDLRRQALQYCAQGEGDLQWPQRPEREAEAVRRQAAGGGALLRELRRCVLAGYGLEQRAPWRDLGVLSETRIAARWDSLGRRDRRGVAAAAQRLELQGLVESVGVTTQALVARARLASLLAQTRRNAGWLDALDAAAAELPGTLPAGLAVWRANALDLARLKRAEDMARFGALALTPDFGAGAWFPPPVREAVAALAATVAAGGADRSPPLVHATLDVHAGLARARELAAVEGTSGDLERLLGELAGNLAVVFDPEAYADHLDRTRMQVLAMLLARGRAPDAVPLAVFPREDRRAALEFLSFEGSGATAQAWRDYGARAGVPFLARWAAARADQPSVERSREPDRFDADFQRLTLAAADLAARAQRGQDWSAALVALRAAAAEFTVRHPAQPSTPDARREQLGRVAALGAALEQPLPLPLERVEVRLGAEQLAGPSEVAVELLAGAGESLCRTPVLLMASDPAGGWRGGRELGQEISLRPGQSLRAVVTRIADGRVLFTARYEGEAAAPGGLLRSVAGGADKDGGRSGDIVFGAPDWFWRRLRVPDLRQPLAATAGM